MENATKALLISASVLIVIVLIAIGMRILSSTSGVTDQVGHVSSTMESAIFNSQFEKYEGQQRGSAVNTLIRLVTQNNLKNTNHQINITKPANINVSHIYTVSIPASGVNADGYITQITVAE